MCTYVCHGQHHSHLHTHKKNLSTFATRLFKLDLNQSNLCIWRRFLLIIFQCLLISMWYLYTWINNPKHVLLQQLEKDRTCAMKLHLPLRPVEGLSCTFPAWAQVSSDEAILRSVPYQRAEHSCDTGLVRALRSTQKLQKWIFGIHCSST